MDNTNKPGETRVTYLVNASSRRHFLAGNVKLLGGVLASAVFPGISRALAKAEQKMPWLKLFTQTRKSDFSVDDELTSYESIINYNNYVEFTSSKKGVARKAMSMKLHPWSVSVEGECDNPMKLDFAQLIAFAQLQERIFPMRCVEGWSKVVPWIGFSLQQLLQKAAPNSKAKYVLFESFYDAKTQQKASLLSSLMFPYVEGLRLDEAMHPLTTLTFGIDGKPLPAQSGGPVRIVVPWKYGFKSAKSIVSIKFVEQQPISTWSRAQPNEYGFYANVNPKVDHPRWSQARERRLGDFFSRQTKMFNGFEKQVGSMYEGMDLRVNY